MADTIICPIGESSCNCKCNCEASLTNNRKVTVNPLIVDENLYTFSYTMTNNAPAISYVVFCIQCPQSKILISGANTTISVIGNPNTTPINFTQCFTSGCQTSSFNRFYVEYELVNENCCRYQGIKINVNPSSSINKINFKLNFTLPEGLAFEFETGNLKLKSGQSFDIINNLCMPGCENCNMQENICDIWQKEKNILASNKDAFIHFTQLILPDSLDLNTITVDELERKIRSISKLEKSSANLICNTSKVLEKLNNLKTEGCYTQCTNCSQHS